MNNHITCLYKTPGGSVWDTYNEALVAHRLESSGVYVESYKLKEIVKAVVTSAPEELGSEAS